MAIKK